MINIDINRHRALNLLQARIIESVSATKRVLDEAADDPITLLEAIFDLFDGVVPQLRTEFGMIGFAALLNDMAEGTLGALTDSQQTLDRRRSAAIIQGYTAVNDVTLDGVLRDIGAEIYEETATEVDEFGRLDETIIGVVDCYLILLPELRSQAMRYWLHNRYA